MNIHPYETWRHTECAITPGGSACGAEADPCFYFFLIQSLLEHIAMFHTTEIYIES